MKEIRIVSKNIKADGVLEGLSKKKQRGVKIIGAVVDGQYNLVFQFNKFLSMVSKGFEDYVRPQQIQFIKDFLLKEGLQDSKDYEVKIE